MRMMWVELIALKHSANSCVTFSTVCLGLDCVHVTRIQKCHVQCLQYKDIQYVYM